MDRHGNVGQNLEWVLSVRHHSDVSRKNGHVASARRFLEAAQRELSVGRTSGDEITLRQAAEKGWGAAREGVRPYMGQSRIQRYLCIYARGQLGSLERKSIEPIAVAAGIPPRTLQQFLGEYEWNEDGVFGRVQRQAAKRSQGAEETMGVVDGTDYAKKGSHTAAVKRQYCGHTGKIDHCVATVGLTYAEPGFHARSSLGLALIRRGPSVVRGPT